MFALTGTIWLSKVHTMLSAFLRLFVPSSYFHPSLNVCDHVIMLFEGDAAVNASLQAQLQRFSQSAATESIMYLQISPLCAVVPDQTNACEVVL